MPDFFYEQQIKATSPEGFLHLLSNDTQPDQDNLVVGVDEAGCGPWAGPVVAGAVIFKDHDQLPDSLNGLLNDSKALSEKRRNTAFKQLIGDSFVPESLDLKALQIHQNYFTQNKWSWVWGIGVANVQDIDSLNIRQATLLAMKRAVEALPLKPQFALVDGISKPSLDCPVQTIKKGDSLSFSISAASILAKVYRDLYMRHIAKSFPEYAWESNAGYGTKQHQEALDMYGVTPHHRTSFKPIADRLSPIKTHNVGGGP